MCVSGNDDLAKVVGFFVLPFPPLGEERSQETFEVDAGNRWEGRAGATNTLSVELTPEC